MLTFALGLPGGFRRKEPCGSHLGPILGRLGRILLASWGISRASLVILLASCWHLGSSCCHLGSSWGISQSVLAFFFAVSTLPCPLLISNSLPSHRLPPALSLRLNCFRVLPPTHVYIYIDIIFGYIYMYILYIGTVYIYQTKDK